MNREWMLAVAAVHQVEIDEWYVLPFLDGVENFAVDIKMSGLIQRLFRSFRLEMRYYDGRRRIRA